MTALAGPTGIVLALISVLAMLVLALAAFPQLRRRVVALLSDGPSTLAALPASRRGLLGISGVEAEDDDDEGPISPGDRRARTPDPNATNHLLAMAEVCGRVDIDVHKTLTQLAGLMPGSLGQGAAWSCRIDLMDKASWSPGYVRPVFEIEAPLTVSGEPVGSITAGPVGDAAAPPGASAQALLDAAAGMASQMLERRADRFQADKLKGELEEQKLTLRQTARLARVGAWEYDGDTGLFKWSDQMRRIGGIDDDKPGRERERQIAKELLPHVEECLDKHRTLDHELELNLPNGLIRTLRVVGDVDNKRGTRGRIVGIVRDLTEEKEALARLTHIANHDVLTELPNRRYFQEQLEDLLRQRGASGALVIIDIDRFKDLNDTSGHDVGDMLLRDFGRRLHEAAGGAFVARLGGDEFAVLLPIADRAAAEHHARTLVASQAGPLVVFGRSATVQVSAGLAMYPEDGRSTSDLLKNADLALYEAKSRGRNMLVAYKPKFREANEERARIRAEVKDALPQKQFVPYYQPKIDLNTGEIAGFEALLRWNHPDGLRAPGNFFAALEDAELSRGLCAVMLDRIIADMARWQAKELPFGRIAFNASSSEFTGFDLAGHLTWRLKSIGVSPTRLGVEVTEAVFLDGTESIGAVLAELRRAGIEIALDDFGTGFASLTHLRDFPVDVIKIDQSFIRNLADDAGSRAITSAVLSLGRGLGKTVVAEGVETVEQAEILRQSGCDQVQGFYFGRPMPAENVPKFIQSWRGAEQISALERSNAA